MSNASTILGGDAVTGEPAVMRSVATHLRTVSANVDTVRDQLRDEGADGWSGGAADAFRSALEEIPGELDKLTSSYDAAATAVSTYASTLEALRSTSDSLATQISAAQQRLDGELASKQGAQREVGVATLAHTTAADPVAVESTRAALDLATSSLAGAKARVTSTNTEIADLRRKAHDNRVAFEDAVKSCCTGLDAASDLGIRNSLGTWYDRHIAHGSPIAQFFDAFVVAPFRDTVEALKAFVADPSLKNLSALLGGVGAILGLVGAVVLIVALGIGTGGTAFAAAGVLLTAATVTTAGKLGVDGYRGAVAREPGAGEDAVDDAIGLVVPKFAGKAVPLATRSGVPNSLFGAGGQMARQEARYAASPTPWSQGWVTRPFNVVKPLAGQGLVESGTGALLDQSRPSSWATGAVTVPGATCPAPGLLFSPSTVVRHPIPAF